MNEAVVAARTITLVIDVYENYVTGNISDTDVKFQTTLYTNALT